MHFSGPVCPGTTLLLGCWAAVRKEVRARGKGWRGARELRGVGAQRKSTWGVEHCRSSLNSSEPATIWSVRYIAHTRPSMLARIRVHCAKKLCRSYMHYLHELESSILRDSFVLSCCYVPTSRLSPGLCHGVASIHSVICARHVASRVRKEKGDLIPC